MSTSAFISSTHFSMVRTAPGPRGLPLVGVLPDIRRQGPLDFLSSVHAQYGDVVRYRLGPFLTHLVCHPDGVRQVLQDYTQNYTKDHFGYGILRQVAGNGLLTSQGSFWLRQRRLAQPAFHRQRIAAMGSQVVAATERMLSNWEQVQARGEPLGVVEAMMRLTLGIVGQALLGTTVDERMAHLVGSSFNVLSEQLTHRFRTVNLLPPVLPTPRDRAFRKARKELLDTVDALIAQKRQQGVPDTGDLLSMFMLARDEDTDEQMTDVQLRDETVTMLIAGHETTAATLSWTWALLEQHPEVEGLLHAELAAVLGGRTPTVEDVPRLRYTRMVVEEAMRLYPPLYVISRKVKDDDVLQGFRIPAGSAVDISPWVLHRRADLWERPDDFHPEHFSAERVARRPRFAFIPFSAGPRQCIGNAFAMMEAQLILATVAQRYRLRCAPGYTLAPEPLLTLRPRGGLPMLLERRPANTVSHTQHAC